MLLALKTRELKGVIREGEDSPVENLFCTKHVRNVLSVETVRE